MDMVAIICCVVLVVGILLIWFVVRDNTRWTDAQVRHMDRMINRLQVLQTALIQKEDTPCKM